MRWWETRCKLPASGYKPGECNAVLFRVNEDGDLEVKCHHCRQIQVMPRYLWDRTLVVSS